MAGSQNIGEESDNPVGINVTAMVDVIFCLCIFFMCSFHFKQLEGRFDTWLPKDKGPNATRPPVVELDEIRVFLRWDPVARASTHTLGNGAPTSGDGELTKAILARVADYKRAGRDEVPVIVDARPEVPWQDVLHVVDLCKGEKLARIEFAGPASDGPGSTFLK